MCGTRFDNGGFESTLKNLNVSGNLLDEGVFAELKAGGYGEIVDLDASWNKLVDLSDKGESLVDLLPKLKVLDVSGHNETIDAEDLKHVPGKIPSERTRASEASITLSERSQR